VPICAEPSYVMKDHRVNGMIAHVCVRNTVKKDGIQGTDKGISSCSVAVRQHAYAGVPLASKKKQQYCSFTIWKVKQGFISSDMSSSPGGLASSRVDPSKN
jgi:hypothetical protein